MRLGQAAITLIQAALWVAKLVTTVIAFNGSALGQFQTEQRVAEITDRSPPRGESGNAAAVHQYAPDLRPVVRVYLSPGQCAPCEAFRRWRENAGDGAPFAFELFRTPHPGWVRSYPSFVFRDAAGRDRVLTGWTGLDRLVRSYTAANPAWQQQSPEPPAVDDSAGRTPLPVRDSRGGFLSTLQGVLDAGGQFDIRPAKPVAVPLDDGTTLRVTALKGRAAQGTITFEEPRPQGTATVAGFWRVGFTVQSVSLEGSGSLAVKTNWRTVRVRIEGWQ